MTPPNAEQLPEEIWAWARSVRNAKCGSWNTDRKRGPEARTVKYTRQPTDGEHCKDCCCARSWKALGVSEYTGKSIPEHIEELKAALKPVAQGEKDE